MYILLVLNILFQIEEQYSYVAPSPIQPLKAIKNEAELNGMRNSSVNTLHTLSTIRLLLGA
jgi:hypothetical protein